MGKINFFGLSLIILGLPLAANSVGGGQQYCTAVQYQQYQQCLKDNPNSLCLLSCDTSNQSGAVKSGGSGSTKTTSNGNGSNPSTGTAKNSGDSAKSSSTASDSSDSSSADTQSDNASADSGGGGSYAPTGFTDSCNANLETLIKACQASATDAQSSCDDSQNLGMVQAQQAANALAKQASGTNGSCAAAAGIAAGANGATAAYQLSCQNSAQTCADACTSAIDYFRKNSGCVVGPPSSKLNLPTALQDAQKTCAAMQSKGDMAQQALQGFMNTIGQAQNCALLSAATDLCKNNPSLPGCSGSANLDCTNPQMATNKVCICAKNPNDPACICSKNSNDPGCIGANSASANLAAGSITGAPTVPKSTDSGAFGSGGDMYGLPKIAQAKADAGAPGGAVDGKQGGGANLGGDSGSGPSGGARGGGGYAGAAGDPAAIYSGSYGGGGSGGFGGGSNYNNGGGSYRGGGFNGGVNGAGNTGAPNLRQFLPGGAYDPRARGVAGASGPDGITGPHSDIWRKIQNRYQVLKSSLMP